MKNNMRAATRLSLLIPTAQVKTNCNSFLYSTSIQTNRPILAAKQIFWFFIFLSTTLLFSSCKNKNTEGKKLYDNHCLHCHQEGGKGVGKLIPPIDKEYMQSNASKLGCIIKYGLKESITIQGNKYNGNMPENDKITDFDIVNILNYINQEFGDGSSKKFNIEELRIDLENCKKK